jgi:hypothetical protein
MLKQQPPLEYGNYYHIYNREINGEVLFREEKDYELYLGLYYRGLLLSSKNISPLRGLFY